MEPTIQHGAELAANRKLAPITVECCDICELPKSRTNRAGEEVEHGWPVCINPNCSAFMEHRASAKYRTQDDIAIQMVNSTLRNVEETK